MAATAPHGAAPGTTGVYGRSTRASRAAGKVSFIDQATQHVRDGSRNQSRRMWGAEPLPPPPTTGCAQGLPIAPCPEETLPERATEIYAPKKRGADISDAGQSLTKSIGAEATKSSTGIGTSATTNIVAASNVESPMLRSLHAGPLVRLPIGMKPVAELYIFPMHLPHALSPAAQSGGGRGAHGGK